MINNVFSSVFGGAIKFSLPLDDVNLRFVSQNATITPSITLSGGGPCQWEVTEADGTRYLYSANSFSHTRTAVGNMTVRLLNTLQVAQYVTVVDFTSDGIISDIKALHVNVLTNLQQLRVGGNAIIGDISLINLSSKIILLYAYLTQLIGDISGVVSLPAMKNLDMGSSLGIYGDLSDNTLTTTARYVYLNGLSITGLPVLQSGAVSLLDFRASNCALPAAAVDAFVAAWYVRWVAGGFVNNCVVSIGGTNADPSGIYQNPFPNPPATSLEKIYVMVNDPFATGNKTQTWSW